MSKEIYLSLMEKVLGAYTGEHIERYTRQVEKDGIKEHGYARLTSNIGILLAHGRIPGMKDVFRRMMDLCCSQIPDALGRNGNGVGNDFAVKEIVFCLLEIEKAGLYEAAVTEKWRSDLKRIDPYKTYSCIAAVPPERIGNWAAFGAASEQIRKYAGIGDESAFIENQIESQMFSFDENGMYRDPNEPMVYDLVTRLQLAVAYWFGFDGKCREALEDAFLRSADITLDMQSVTGEIPFGGRSNQFLHNEAFLAALCEFYASLFKKRGDTAKAGIFKRAAEKAYQSVTPWLEKKPLSHIKNRFPVESGYGCEGYAYFDKYMVTAGSWFYLAYVFADDGIEITICPADQGCRVTETTGYFHKVFCSAGGYFAEYDTCADPHYDASGLGRIHIEGAPSALCLSVPFPKAPSYRLDNENPSPFSICGGILTENGWVRGYDAGYKLTGRYSGGGTAKAEFACVRSGEELFRETCSVSGDGVAIEVSGDGDVEIVFPVFDFDGTDHTSITASGGSVSVSYGGYVCRFASDGAISAEGAEYGNRNGRYLAYSARGKNRVRLDVKIFPDGVSAR
ncbi:MAG: hypothetical protein K6D94_06240 [Clostridiales bacterium]|nr:hypothetical protein [Clostridiales bacterium]